MLVKDELEGSSESETGPLGLLTATGFMPTTDRERAQRVADRIEAARARLARRRLERMDNASLDAVVDAILAIDDRSVGGRSLIADLAAKTVPVPEDGRADVVEIVVVTRHASLITDKTPQG